MKIRDLTPVAFCLAAGICSGQAEEIHSFKLSELDGLSSERTLFTEVAKEDSGIVFDNRFENPERWRSLWRQYFIGSIGTGVSLGDVNGDQLPDLFLVGKDVPNALYLNVGDFRFEDVTKGAGVAGTEGFGTGSALVDIDNDGDLDLYVCYVGTANELFLNDGKGSFRKAEESCGLFVVAGSNAPAFADYDGDGDLDLYLQCNYWEAAESPAGLPDLLFRNDGGVFTEVTKEAGIEGNGQGHAAIWRDFDDDGLQDIYVSNDFAENDKLYRNNGDGTFTDVLKDMFEFAPYSAMGADSGDLNNDGHPELVVGEMKPRERGDYMKSVGPLSGKLFSIDQNGVSQYMQNAVAVSVAAGKYRDFGYLTGMAATDWTWAPRIVDLDCDGWEDVFFTTGMARAFHDADLGLRVARAKSRQMQVALYQKSPVLEERNLAFCNLGGLRFEEVGNRWGLDESGVSLAAAFADFDKDGDLDLLVSNWNGIPTLYRNNSDVGQRVVVELEGVTSNRMGLGARVFLKSENGQQMREMISSRGYMSGDEVAAFFSVEEGTMTVDVRIEWPSGISQAVGALKPGYRYRIRETGMVSELGSRNTIFVRSEMQVTGNPPEQERLLEVDRDQALQPFYEDREGPPVAIADFDGDGWDDIVVAGPAGSPIRIFQNKEGRSLQLLEIEAFKGTVDPEAASLLLLDYNRDGRMDLLVGNGGVEHPRGSDILLDRIYLNLGGMRFVETFDATLQRVPLSTGKMIRLEQEKGKGTFVVQAGGPIANTFPLAEINRVYRLRESGLELEESTFSADLAASGKLTDIRSFDIDADGDSDLLTVAQWGEPLLWINDDGAFVRQRICNDQVAISGYWTCVAVEDLNGDGLSDLLLGNLGLNTKIQVSEKNGYELFYSADPFASPRLFIESEIKNGVSYPLETRTLHQMYLPNEMRATGSYETYGKLSVKEAFGDSVLAGLEVSRLNETRSFVFIQEDDGQFSPMPLPQMAQGGRVMDIATGDFDRNGTSDVVLVIESVAPQPWVALGPNQSTILLLLNDGSGKFESILPWESGLVIEEGQPKKLSVADLDKDRYVELVVSCSDGPLYVFETTGMRNSGNRR